MNEAIQERELEINHNLVTRLDALDRKVSNGATLVLSPTEMVTKIFSGLKIYLDPRDQAVSIPLSLDYVWEHHITTAWLKCLRPTDTVFDVGANFGYYGVLAAQNTARKSSTVVLFEPNPALIPYLTKTLNVNWLHEQTTIAAVAVGDKAGNSTLTVLDDYVGSSTLLSAEELEEQMGSKMDLSHRHDVPVDVITLDAWAAERGITTVDLVKIDVEGFEPYAYAGMRQLVAASPELTLFLEFTPKAYADPEGFFRDIYGDFGHVYRIGPDAGITAVDVEQALAEALATDDWVMPIFSKRADLDRL
jgi:FkbM family methyltransferase